jgi:putative acetyltransferase
MPVYVTEARLRAFAHLPERWSTLMPPIREEGQHLFIEMRPEGPVDVDVIRKLTSAAFRDRPYSSGTEAAIIDALRQARALTMSLVAVQDGAVAGHVAFSPVTINGAAIGWYGLGPVSVWPDRQRKGIGQALIRDGLDRLRRMDAQGCVLLGDPGYYGRFGFVSDPGLRYGAAPPGYFQRLAFGPAVPEGEVAFHPGFDAT